MTTIVAFEAKNPLSELLRRAQHGEEIVITRHGRPLARLTGFGNEFGGDDVRAAFAQLKVLRKGTKGGRRAGESLATFRHEGHRW
jgi:prevent-host-death family protein